ncbi:50S ribosomal protein L4 [candidate division TM6 bacterium RIFCSPHIGHO2_12_FULL_36_22]|nr:MAG: 50S ribosomal protein L4 [candidate division TM6 bacterium RIFCSPHIGHO2_12_FULL_36_22]
MTEQKTENKKGLTVLTAQDVGLTARVDASNAANFSQYVRTLLLNWRQGTVGVKGRSDVSYSNKKPWKQKGTGRARAGSARSPLWRGGGVIFGPQARTRKVSVPKALKKRVLNELFGQLLDNNAVIILNWMLNSNVPKTSLANRMLKEHNLYDSKILLMLSNDDILMQRSFSNLPNVRLVLFDQINAFDLAHAEKVLVFEKDMDSFKEMVARWN